MNSAAKVNYTSELLVRGKYAVLSMTMAISYVRRIVVENDIAIK